MQQKNNVNHVFSHEICLRHFQCQENAQLFLLQLHVELDLKHDIMYNFVYLYNFLLHILCFI